MKELSLYETRVIGALIEKSLTTPDQYPLSVNALTNACNQKSNRNPVLELAESTVMDTVDSLLEAGFIAGVSGSGSRITKYKHRFCNTEFSEYKLSSQELGVVCVLFLRGAQTPGEIRTRTQRLCDFRDVQQVEITLHRMMTQYSSPLLLKLSREAGKRESRYLHLFGAEEERNLDAELSTRVEEVKSEPLSQRVEALESHVASMKVELDELKQMLDDLTS